MPNEDGTLTQEEYESLSPSDRAHYDVKGRLGDGMDAGDTDATKTARAVAFESASAQETPDDDVDASARADEVEQLKKDAGVGESTDAGDDVVFDGITGPDGDGHPQTTDEAVAAEKARREEMSEAELAEAETRDALADGTEGGSDAANDAEIPNLGSTDPEKTEE